MLSHVLIFHGRRICFARKPSCATCPVRDACPSAFKAELIGRKSPRVRIDANHSGRGALAKAKVVKPKPKAKPKSTPKATLGRTARAARATR